MDWRLANSLVTLRNQVNAEYPRRSKASDGTIGDSAHAAVKSEHNPNADGVVTAIDITHDPASGADMQRLADALLASNDRRIWYIIFNKRIVYLANKIWQPYSGANDHTKHMHLSTNQSPDFYDDPRPWKLTEGVNMDYREAYEDAERYKQAIVRSEAWKGDFAESIDNITPVINDLQRFKRDAVAQAAPPRPTKEAVIRYINDNLN